ncbi:MAG: hypothetical protein U9N50_10225 [Pseudomonadota bacterium]|nr:hypothetical protein [Pseudomonadota bacterium]
MSKNELKNCGEKDLIDLASFWRRLIDELEMKNPDDVLPEMREALADTEACLEELASVTI